MNKLKRFESLSIRVKTALILAAVFISAIIAASMSCTGVLVLSIGLALAVALAAYEGVQLYTEGISRAPLLGAGVFAILLLPAAVLLITKSSSNLCEEGGMAPLDAFTLVAILSLVSALMTSVLLVMQGRGDISRIQRSLQELPVLLILIAVGGGALLGLCFVERGALLVFWMAWVVCLNDISAYFGGSYFRGPKLAPALSPGKTISGSASGFLGGAVAGIGVGLILFSASTVASLAIASVVIIFFAQLGDLLKSYLKRLHGAKDSGSILPGHGGVLDRIDGLLGAAPALLLGVAASAFF